MSLGPFEQIAPQEFSSRNAVESQARTITNESQYQISAWLTKLLWVWAVAGLFVQPLLFGGVHPPVFLFFQACSCLLCAGLIINLARSPLVSTKVFSKSTGLTLFFLIGLSLYAALQYLALSQQDSIHPVLGQTTRIADYPAFYSGYISLVSFVATFFCCSLLLNNIEKPIRKLFNCIAFATVAFAIVAISHWFYDNGKLFWVFEPNNLVISQRARWPFVNPSHLAAFLIPGFFVLLARVEDDFNDLFLTIRSKHSRSTSWLQSVAIDPQLQSKFFTLLFYMLGLVVTCMALLGTQSRGAWLALALGMLSFLVLGKLSGFEPQTNSAEQPQARVISMRSRRRKRNKSSNNSGLFNWLALDAAQISKFAKLLVAFLVVALLWLLLSGTGNELISERISYGLLASKDDIRWRMYADSLQMLTNAPFLGVGLGGWGASYWSYMSPLLAGINPVHLHSDIFQFLLEFGFLGAIPILLLSVGLLTRSIKLLRDRSYLHRSALRAFISALIAFTLCGAFDFPFRIPANLFLLAISLAMLSFLLDLRESQDNQAV